MGVLGIYGAASPGECVWVACHLLLAQGFVRADCWGFASLPVSVSLCPLCLARGSLFIYLLALLVDHEILEDPEGHPSCFQATGY